MNGKSLRFGDVVREPDVRMLDDMRNVLMDRQYADEADNRPLYYMYRDLYRDRDRQTIEDHGIRYDITVIPASHIGREYVKTKGHYHPEANRGVTYPEVYEVIEGQAHYLLQRPGPDGGITDVIVVRAQAGDKVVIPPGYGHITINPSNRKLVMANWVSRNFSSEYGEIAEKRGGAYYETISDEFIHNPRYDGLPKLRMVTPTHVPDIGLTREKPMYNLVQRPDRLAFLNRPHKYGWVFEDLY